MPGTLTVTPDKPSYNTGDPVTVTVTGNMVQADQITVTDPEGDSGTGTINVVQALQVSDPAGRVWVTKSNDGKTAVLTSTA